MGGVGISQIGKGVDLETAYNKLVEEANREYGRQEGYSGEINCTDFCRAKRLDCFKENELVPMVKNEYTGRLQISDVVYNKMHKHSEELYDSINGKGVYGIKLGIYNYAKVYVKVKKYSTRKLDYYYVRKIEGTEIEYRARSLEDAIKYIERVSKKDFREREIIGYLKNKSTIICAESDVKITETRRKPKDMNDVQTIYLFWFIGFARC